MPGFVLAPALVWEEKRVIVLTLIPPEPSSETRIGMQEIYLKVTPEQLVEE